MVVYGVCLVLCTFAPLREIFGRGWCIIEHVDTIWTTDEILRLSPDASSTKAGQKLATPRTWPALGRSERVVWGECQGSGKTPYKTQIDLDGQPAFNCTCPSRKFPCKHALGLFLLLATMPDRFTEAEPPAWVTEWLDKRKASRERKAKQAEQTEQPLDPARQAKREAQKAKSASKREKEVHEGLELFERRMRDLVRQGLANAQNQPYSFWEDPAKRLSDAKASGLRRRVLSLAGVASSGVGWEERLLNELGKLYLLLEGYKRIDTLPNDVQADIRTVIGWTQKKEEILAQPDGVRDQWLVIGQAIEEIEDHLRMQRIWLWEETGHRTALILRFAYGKEPLETSLIPGTCIDAELAFYPSAYPLRVEIKERHGTPARVTQATGYPTIASAIAAYTTALAHNPWLDTLPFLLDSVTPVRTGTTWAVYDTAGYILPLALHFQQGWHLLAISGGDGVTLAGEWDGHTLLPLGVWNTERFYALERTGSGGTAW